MVNVYTAIPIPMDPFVPSQSAAHVWLSCGLAFHCVWVLIPLHPSALVAYRLHGRTIRRWAVQTELEIPPWLHSMDWIRGNFTGKPHIQWENLWFPVDFPLNQSIDTLELRCRMRWPRWREASSCTWDECLPCFLAVSLAHVVDMGRVARKDDVEICRFRSSLDEKMLEEEVEIHVSLDPWRRSRISWRMRMEPDHRHGSPSELRRYFGLFFGG
jgi:hypothetical protein